MEIKMSSVIFLSLRLNPYKYQRTSAHVPVIDISALTILLVHINRRCSQFIDLPI